MDSTDLFYLVDAELAEELWKLIADKESWTRFADLTGDPNPLHRNSAYAQEHEFDDVIAPGMYSAAFVSAVYQTLGNPRTLTHSFKFREPVYHGDHILPIIYSEKVREGYSVDCISGEKKVLEGRIGFPQEAPLENPAVPPWNHDNSARFDFNEHTVLDYLVSLGILKIFEEFPDGIVPDMFIGACFTGLMLNEGGNEGAYRTLDLRLQRPVAIGESLILVSEMGQERERKGLRTCEFALAAYADYKAPELVAHGISKGFLKSNG